MGAIVADFAAAGAQTRDWNGDLLNDFNLDMGLVLVTKKGQEISM